MALLLVGAACRNTPSGVEATASGEPHQGAPGGGALRSCEVEFTPPAPYRRVGRNEVAASDHVGVRVTFSAGAVHKLYFTSGISGEFGETLPLIEEPPVPDGGTGRLMGAGATWILTWDEDDACGRRSVTGIGLSKPQFTEVLARSGVVPPEEH